MSAAREITALWSRCAALRQRMSATGTAPGSPAGRELDRLVEELASATRRLETAGMLTAGRAGHLRDAAEALAGARFGRVPPATAVARCTAAVEALAASFRIRLPAMGAPAAFDYDTRPERFRTAAEVARRYSTRGDIHERVAARLATERAVPVVDTGCGTGRLLRLLVDAGIAAVGVDRSLTMLREARGRRRIGGDVRTLPLPGAFAGAVAALYVLNHLPDPSAAVAEAWRVLRPGGLYVVSAVSRHDSPEIGALLPPAPPPTFDAELAPGLLHDQGFTVEVDAWDVPGGLVLPDAAAVQAYLIGRILPAAVAERVARAVIPPLEVTRRGALVWGRKPG
jgi:SAM-dependent methyltransferase